MLITDHKWFLSIYILSILINKFGAKTSKILIYLKLSITDGSINIILIHTFFFFFFLDIDFCIIIDNYLYII